MKNVSIKGILVYLFGFVVISSCTNNPSEPIAGNSGKVYSFKAQLNNTIYSYDGTIESCRFYRFKYSEVLCSVSSSKIDEFVKKMTTKYSNVKGISLIINNYENLSLESNILGFSLYYIHQNKLIHAYFSNDNNDFVENPYYNCESKGYMPNTFEIYYLLNLGNPSNENIKIVNLFSDLSDQSLDNPQNKLALKLALANKKLLKFYTKQRDQLLDIDRGNGGSPTGCGTHIDCAGGTSDEECYADNTLVPFMCHPKGSGDVPTLCPRDRESGLLISNGDSVLSSVAFNKSLEYSFRDDFLTKTVYGKALDTYYYALHNYIDSSITLQLAISTAQVMIDFNQVIMKLLNPSQYENDILLPLDLKIDLLQLLNTYRALNSDNTYLLMIDDVIDDVNLFSTFTIGQFCNYIYYEY